jgi:hypothetical protein
MSKIVRRVFGRERRAQASSSLPGTEIPAQDEQPSIIPSSSSSSSSPAFQSGNAPRRTDLSLPPAHATPPPHTNPSRIGLTVLFEPDNPQSAIVDIIFLHGLTGGSYQTWYHKDSNTYWPRDLLKNEISDSRIMVLGYDADIVGWWSAKSLNTLPQFGRDVLGQIAGEREDTDTVSTRYACTFPSKLKAGIARSENHLRWT